MTPEITNQHAHFLKVQKVIEFLTENYQSQPSLQEIAVAVGMSPYHLQRTFSQWAGVSPKQFIGFLTKEHAKEKLKKSSVLDAAFSSGLSGGGRLHDLLVTCDSVTPGEYKSKGDGLLIEFGFHPTPFGFCLLANTARGICHISLFDDFSDSEVHLRELKNIWVNATVSENQAGTGRLAEAVFPIKPREGVSIKVLLNGSPFKMKIWEALLKIPYAELSSYQQVAKSVGQSSASRAVASAVAANNIAYLIPCHRVIRSTGVLNAYRWGASRKAALIGWENCQ